MSPSPHLGTMRPPAQGADRTRWLALALLALAQFMLVLDVTVINVALPRLSHDLAVDPAAAAWAVAAYAIPFGGLLLLGGRAADLFGARRTFLTGLATFTVASLAAGSAPDAATLFAARAAQGMGAALMSPAALGLVTTRFAGPERVRALAAWGAVGAAGSAVGVLLGGLLTAGPGWRWVFFINVPVGVALMALVPMVIHAAPRRRSGSLGVVPGVLVTLAAGSLIFGVSDAAEGFSTQALAIVVSIALFAAFLLLERRSRQPLVARDLAESRALRAGLLVMLSASGVLVGAFFLLSFALQARAGWSALQAGLAFLPVALATLVGAHGAGHVAARMGRRGLAVTAFLLAAAGAALAAAQLDNEPMLIAGGSLAALGLGGAFVAATTTALGDVREEQAGVGSALVNTAHELGAALGVSLLSAAAAPSLDMPSTSEGFTWAFVIATLFAVTAAAVSGVLMPRGGPSAGMPRFVH